MIYVIYHLNLRDLSPNVNPQSRLLLEAQSVSVDLERRCRDRRLLSLAAHEDGGFRRTELRVRTWETTDDGRFGLKYA
jgi:hypothetical protein